MSPLPKTPGIGAPWLVALGLLLPASLPAASSIDSPAVESRAEALLAQMTLQEKIGQLNQLSNPPLKEPVVKGGLTGTELIRQGQVGGILNAVKPEEIDALQKIAVEQSRLHIPILFGLDVIHGYRTIFPIPLALSCSWDTDLIRDTARMAAKEASQHGIRWTFSPMVDIARDARWGRMAEGAGEDTYLGSAIARAYVEGYQGNDLSSPDAVAACAKHFVGYGAAEAGREYNTTEISERTLRAVYLPPFKAAADAGVATFMSAFNCLDGVPASANGFTLTEILRDEWGYKGLVDSDWTAVGEVADHGLADDMRGAAKASLLAGVDMDMASLAYIENLSSLVKSGEIPESKIDEAVMRILRVKIALGLFEHPYVQKVDHLATSSDPEAKALAFKAAQESIVLLQNQEVWGEKILPLSSQKVHRIALIGPFADSANDMLGCWTGQGQPQDAITLKTALTERARKEGIGLSFAEGVSTGVGDDPITAALAAAHGADLAIVAVGEPGQGTGEATSRTDLGLSGGQELLVESLYKTGVPIVLVIFNGRPINITWAAKHVPAVVEAWYPGLQAGPALVSTLFGDTEPVGRLTVTYPRAVGQEPLYYNQFSTGRPKDDWLAAGLKKPDEGYMSAYIDEANTGLYPFGFGLGYTSYGYSLPKVDSTSLSAEALNDGKEKLTVTAEVTNTGKRDGTETAQLYIRLHGTSVARPMRELKGFQRIRLAAGETKKVTFTLGRDELAFWNVAMKDVVEPSSLYVWVAGDSATGKPVKVEIGK